MTRGNAGIVAVGAALGLTLAGLGIAAAQTDGSTTTTIAPAPSTPGAPDQPPRKERLLRHKQAHPFGKGPGIHGEFTTRKRDGGYQTIATQVGEVTAASATSITVKSEDGFTRTYAVDDNTLVNAGNEGIADVKTGDDVSVTALVVDGNASAVEIDDGTRLRELRDRWAPGPRR